MYRLQPLLTMPSTPSPARSVILTPSRAPLSPPVQVKKELVEEDQLVVRRLPTRTEVAERSEERARVIAEAPVTQSVCSGSATVAEVFSPTPRERATPQETLQQDTKPFGPQNDPFRPPPGTESSYVFPTNRPLRSLLAGISNNKFEDPEFPGKRRPSLDLGGSTGNMNPHYRSPSPELREGDGRRSGPPPDSPYSQWFRRASLFDAAAHQRRASRGNLAHMHHPAQGKRPEKRPFDAPRAAVPLLSAPRAAMSLHDAASRNKRKRADPEQLAALVQVFERTPFPTTEERHALALKLGMTSRSVQIWFQNRRQTTKAAQMSAAQLAAIAVNDDLGPSIAPHHRALTISQLEALNDHFLGKSDVPDDAGELQLSQNLGLDVPFIKGWFAHRCAAAAHTDRRGSQ